MTALNLRGSCKRRRAVAWVWMRVADLRNALRYPWDHTAGGQASTQNDNDLVLLGGVWTHRTQVDGVRAYYRKHGWKL